MPEKSNAFRNVVSEAQTDFEAPADAETQAMPTQELIGLTAACIWSDFRLILWACDDGQAQREILLEVVKIGRTSPLAAKLAAVYEHKASWQLVRHLANLAITIAWLAGEFGKRDPGRNGRATMFAAGLLPELASDQVLRDLQVDKKPDFTNLHQPEDLHQIVLLGTVERERALRQLHGNEFMNWLRDNMLPACLSTPLPPIDGRRVGIDGRWNQEELCRAVLVDVVARLALPYSDEANQIRNAAHWAKSDAFDKRDAKKRGGPGVRKTKKAAKVAGIAVKRVEVVNLEAVSESVFRDLGGAKSQSSVEDELDARQRAARLLSDAEKAHGAKGRQLLEAVLEGANISEAAEEAGISPASAYNWLQDVRPARSKPHPPK